MTLLSSVAPTAALCLALALVVAGCESASTGNLVSAPQPNLDLLTSDDGFVTTGGAEITLVVNDVTERWSFVAKRGQGGVAKGNFQWSGKIFGAHVNAHGYVTCFGIDGHRARLGGVVTHSNTPGFVGAEVIWSVEDNGEGSSALLPDRATALQVGEPDLHCPLAPVPDPTLLPVETGNVQVHG